MISNARATLRSKAARSMPGSARDGTLLDNAQGLGRGGEAAGGGAKIPREAPSCDYSGRINFGGNRALLVCVRPSALLISIYSRLVLLGVTLKPTETELALGQLVGRDGRLGDVHRAAAHAGGVEDLPDRAGAAAVVAAVQDALQVALEDPLKHGRVGRLDEPRLRDLVGRLHRAD